ncbi:PD-(D/E)XK nuclease family protein [Demequina sp. SO4-18]|uniref:PD-(D/E)XK nuclease family protein n=1 Tax=Demequina sp. SO4-18 TaxID=3401026 RepID=UPI003B5B264A
MATDLMVDMVAILGRSRDPGFNVFDVMHHGGHEKQLSNVFQWLLEPEGSHGFGDTFVRIFIDSVNQRLGDGEYLPHGSYWARQEVNTSGAGSSGDIADIVVEGESALIVVENYFTSDGHGHSYDGYMNFARREGKRGVVVLLCRDVDSSRQREGWQNAVVLSYRDLVGRLLATLGADRVYQRKNPHAFVFVEQMHSKYVKGKGRMEDHDVLGFVVAMCDTGEARRYGEQPGPAGERFASDLADQARERFGEGRELLQRVKDRLRTFAAGPLTSQLNTTLGAGAVGKVNIGFQGTYQWTVNITIADEGEALEGNRLQFKFGPSAWFANEMDADWQRTVDSSVVDYSRIFITRSARKEIRQSSVGMAEVLDGLEASDTRLHDEIVALLREDI